MSEDDRQPTVEHGCPAPRDGDDRTGTRVSVPFDGGFLADVKEAWPHGTRLWSPDDETWWVAEGHEDEVEALVEHHYGGVRIVHPDGGEELRDAGGRFEQRGLW